MPRSILFASSFSFLVAARRAECERALGVVSKRVTKDTCDDYRACVFPVRPIMQTNHNRPTSGIAIRTQIQYMFLPLSQGSGYQCREITTHRMNNQCVCVSEFHLRTSELQSPCNLVCRLLLEKKKK